jgi:AcrR family transcriptional regulator
MVAHKTKKERRAEIFEAAIKCFAEKGYYETTMDDIVRQSGLSKGTLYWHFESKKELFRHLIEHWQTEYVGELTGLDNATTARAKLAVLKDALKTSVAVSPDLVRAQLEFYTLAIRDEGYREWLVKAYADQIGFLRTVLEEGMEHGEFRRFPADPLVRLLGAYIDGALLQQELYEHAEGPGALLDECFETFMELIEAPAHE